MEFIRRRFFILAFLAVLTILYGLSLRAYYVGFFNDDAFHIIGSRSLLSGRYVELNHPDEPPLVHYMPGYPLLLAPVSFFSPSSFIPYQILSLLLVLVALFLIWILWKDRSPPSVFCAVLILSSLNPLTVSLSGTVLSDIPFLTFSVLLAVLLFRYWEKREARMWVGIAVVASFLFYLRPVGIVFTMAIVLALVIEKRFKLAVLCAGVAVMAAVPYLLRNLRVSGTLLPLGSEYALTYGDKAPWLHFFSILWNNARFYLNEIFVRLMFRWPNVRGVKLLNGATIVLGSVAVVWGGRSFGWKRAHKFVLIFLALYFMVHLTWGRESGRYLLPVLPFLYFLTFLGVWDLGRRFFPKAKLESVALGISVFLLLFPLGRILRASLMERSPINTPPKKTLAWIKENTDKNDIVAAELDGRIYLLTGRKTVHLTNDPNRFYSWVDRSKINYILVFPLDYMLKTQSVAKAYHPLTTGQLMALMSHQKKFSLVYKDSEEGSVLYKVVSST